MMSVCGVFKLLVDLNLFVVCCIRITYVELLQILDILMEVKS